MMASMKMGKLTDLDRTVQKAWLFILERVCTGEGKGYYWKLLDATTGYGFKPDH